jgi:hypothetical protein
MKVVGKDEIGKLDVGYKIYKQLVEEVLDQGFKEFLTKKYGFKRRLTKLGENYEEEELHHVENRIEICQ